MSAVSTPTADPHRHSGDPPLMSPRVPHNALGLGRATGQMLSTHIVAGGEPLATLIRS